MAGEAPLIFVIQSLIFGCSGKQNEKINVDKSETSFAFIYKFITLEVNFWHTSQHCDSLFSIENQKART